jgi:hypothetical protein
MKLLVALIPLVALAGAAANGQSDSCTFALWPKAFAFPNDYSNHFDFGFDTFW